MKSIDINPLLRPAIRAIEPEKWNLQRRPDLLELQFGENQEPLSENVLRAIADSGRTANYYSGLQDELVNTIATSKGVRPDHITITNGTDEAFRLISGVFIEPGDVCLLFVPTYPAIKPSVKMMGGTIHPLALGPDHQLPSLEDIRPHLTPRTKMIYLANPNLPVGNLMANLDQIRAFLERPLVVVVDECYVEISHWSAYELVNQYPNLIITRTFSKTYGLAGLRIGYLLANAETTAILSFVKVSIDSFIPSTSMAAAIAALKDEAHLTHTLARVATAKQTLNAGLRALGLTVWDTLTTHTLVDVSPAGFTAPAFVEKLRGNGVLVKTCEVYDCEEAGWVFFGIPPLDRVEWVLERVKEVIRYDS